MEIKSKVHSFHKNYINPGKPQIFQFLEYLSFNRQSFLYSTTKYCLKREKKRKETRTNNFKFQKPKNNFKPCLFYKWKTINFN